MRYVKQFLVILAVSLLGETLSSLIPLPVPASIYGLILMLMLLMGKVVKVSDVKETSAFMIDIMPLTFIPAAVGLMTFWRTIRSNLAAYIVITVVSTLAVFFVSGRVTQRLLDREGK